MAGPQTEWGTEGTAQHGTGLGDDLLNLGGIVLQPVYQDVATDPFDGTSRVFRFRGTVANLNAAQLYIYDNYQWQTRIETNGTQWPELVITIPNPGSNEFTVRWEFSISFIQQDLFINIAALNYLQGQGLALSAILNGKQTCLAAYNQGVTYDEFNQQQYQGNGGPLLQIYSLLLTSGASVRVAQPVLTRKRTYDISYTGATMATLNTQTVWSTTALISAFEIPEATSSKIVADPSATALSGLFYGWKQEKNDLIIIPAKNKITEELSWVWDQWPALLYHCVG